MMLAFVTALGVRVLVTVGRMDPRERYKGHDRVTAAISNLVVKGHDIFIWSSGRVPIESASKRLRVMLV